MIYTSYFGNYRNFPSEYMPYSIAVFPPKNSKYHYHIHLTPDPNLVELYKEGVIGIHEYTAMYLDELLNDRGHVDNLLHSLNNRGNCILLCYEKPPDFCHRHLLQKYVNLNLPNSNIKIKEL